MRWRPRLISDIMDSSLSPLPKASRMINTKCSCWDLLLTILADLNLILTGASQIGERGHWGLRRKQFHFLPLPQCLVPALSPGLQTSSQCSHQAWPVLSGNPSISHQLSSRQIIQTMLNNRGTTVITRHRQAINHGTVTTGWPADQDLKQTY